MIGRLTGRIVKKKAPYLLLDVGGVGYEVEVPMSTFFALPALDECVQLKTHLAVREDAHVLYGFISDEERDLFRSLIKVNGVGAKVALGILSGISVGDFILCVQQKNFGTLTRLPGIGKKTAERLVIEMRDRLPACDGHDSASPRAIESRPESAKSEAISALLALGFKLPDATRLAEGANRDNASSEEILRAALQATVK